MRLLTRIGSGKTSLIKSIVQTCEDIVHIDPLESNTTPAASATLTRSRSSQSHTTETYASTKPYPSWWSEIDESRVLRRRKSLGDGVLERNICFVDTTPSKNGEHLIQYMEQQLRRAMGSPSMPNGDFLHLLSGSGGPQVDVVLFLIFKGVSLVRVPWTLLTRMQTPSLRIWLQSRCWKRPATLYR